MRSSPKKQPEFDFAPADSSVQAPSSDIGEMSSEPTPQSVDTTASIAFRDGGVSSDLYAIAARRAGRLNAANVSDEELDALLRERQLLLDRKFAGTLTRAEEVRLTYV
jgi:hypothetical protein